jgi:glycosyltransferase involved in cell wall biosynthesis
MRLLFCNYEYPPIGGGGGVVMQALATALARQHEVTVLTSRMGDLAPESIERGVRIVRVPVFFRRPLEVANFPSMAAFLPSALGRGLFLAGERRFDVINTHFALPTGPLGEGLARLARLPNVLTVHGGDLYDPSKFSSPHRYAVLRRTVGHLLRRAEVIVAQSHDTLANIRRIYGVHRPVKLVPLGIERPLARARGDRAALSLPENAFVLVSVGRIVPRKACSQLMRVLAMSADRAWHLLLVGDGPDLPVVRQTASELGLADRVRFLGHVDESVKLRALSVADVFVSTSQHEGFGLVFLEAMASGLPVVCYDCGGQTDFLSTPETGRVVPLNDIEAFTAAVRELSRSPEQRAEICRHNLMKVEQYFIDRCAARYEAIFAAVARERAMEITALQRH